MSRVFRFILYAAAFILPPLVVGALRLRPRITGDRSGRTVRLAIDTAALPPAPALDPAKPTVVVLLGADATEITDALGPYELYARAGLFNVVTAAPERRPTRFTGGLGVLPDFSLAELDRRLAGRAPAVVVVPAFPSLDLPANQPLIAYLRRQAAAGSLINSWCAGAAWVAAAGLVDGRRITTHWGDIGYLEDRYPRARWVRGLRWVDEGNVVSSAGITSGIDASLHVIRRLVGDSVARRVAAEMRYPNYRYVTDPAVEQYVPRAADAILLANGAFRTGRPQIGVALYEGIGELDVAHLYDAHAASHSADLYGVAAAPGVVRTQGGMTLVPELVAASSGDGAAILRRLDRLVVAGADGEARGAAVARAVTSVAPGLRAEYLQSERAGRFTLEPVMEDLARTADLPTARIALKRVEYRSASVRLDGSAIPWRTLLLPIALGLGGLSLALLVRRLRTRGAAPTVAPRAAQGAAA
jgi:AraC family transcriptional regulator, transcriptional activator FtrA